MKHSLLSSKTVLILAATTLGGAPVVANADSGLALSVLGAASLQNPSVSDNGQHVKVDGSTSFGGGLAAEGVIGDALGLEVGALYLNHEFKRDTANFFNTTIASTVHSGYLQIPVLLRYHPIPFVNLGVGGYYSRVLSGWNVSASGFGDVGANYDKNDFGLVAAVGTIVPLGDNFALTGDVRYARSLTDSARQTNDALKFSDFQALVGVRFGIN